MKEYSPQINNQHFTVTFLYQEDQIKRLCRRYERTISKRKGELFKGEIFIDGESENLISPLFFENATYHFEIEFSLDVEQVRAIHKLNYINDKFYFRRGRLSGTLDTKNDLGNFCLPFEYVLNGKKYQSFIKFEILPTKIDYHQDLPQIYKVLDQQFPLWRFSFASKTEQGTGKSQDKGYFPLLWLAHFQQLQKDFDDALKVICNSPHNRLKETTIYCNADRIKGRVSEKLAQKIRNDQKNSIYKKKYTIGQKKLSTDTPENRFIKMVVIQIQKRLKSITQKIQRVSYAQDSKGKFSNELFKVLADWQKPLKCFQRLPMFNNIGEYHGLKKTSLVLQQKVGYRKIFSIWQELKYYLDAVANQTYVSMKSISELYEVWCFLMVRNVLINELNFNEISVNKKALNLKILEYQLLDGEVGAFKFERGEGKNKIKISLIHERRFTKKSLPTRSYLVTQKPDIYLEVEYSDKKRYVWLFDAKYRVEYRDEKDLVPDDAINQMHRYRDALIHLEKDLYKTRPVFGAFALYPGYFDQEHSENPYKTAIDEMGIGAFALLPSDDNSGVVWLTKYLEEQLNKYSDVREQQEWLSVQEPARISYSGMNQTLYDDLVLLIPLGDKLLSSGNERNAQYFESFKDKTAKYYHVPKSVFEEKYGKYIATELNFLALAEKDKNGDKFINKFWRVTSVKTIKRCEITKEQSGYESELTEIYYLFELGSVFDYSITITNIPIHFRPSMKLTTLRYIANKKDFTKIQDVYTEGWIKSK